MINKPKQMKIAPSLMDAIEQLSRNLEKDFGIAPTKIKTTHILGEAIIFSGLTNPKKIIPISKKNKKGKLPRRIEIQL